MNFHTKKWGNYCTRYLKLEKCKSDICFCYFLSTSKEIFVLLVHAEYCFAFSNEFFHFISATWQVRY